MRGSRPAATPFSGQQGFSLIELLMVAFILAVGLLGLTALVTSNLRAQGGGRERDTASYLANDVLERLAADGRATATLRANAQAIPPAVYLLNEAVDNTANVYQAPDPANVMRTTFDMAGRPSVANPLFSVNWVRRATKSVVPVASSASQTAEVVVNVTWSETGQGTAIIQKWMSCSRMIRY